MAKRRSEGGCLLAIVAVMVLPAAWVVDGALVALLWRWFMVPLHLPAIGAAHAFGVATLAATLTGRAAPKQEEAGDDMTTLVVKSYTVVAARALAILAMAGATRAAMGWGW